MSERGDPQATDEALVARAHAGDEVAVQTLLERHRQRLLGRARRRMPALLKRRVAASDVVQECLLVASRRLPDFEDQGEGSFGRWLRQILDHKVRDGVRNHLKRDKRAAGREVSQGGRRSTHAFSGGVETPSRIVGRREEEAQAKRALEHLAEDHRTILRLVHEGGLTTAQAAEALGRTPEATRKLYSRAITKLAAALEAKRNGSGE